MNALLFPAKPLVLEDTGCGSVYKPVVIQARVYVSDSPKHDSKTLIVSQGPVCIAIELTSIEAKHIADALVSKNEIRPDVFGGKG